MKQSFTIVGAGMAGLLAANMLSRSTTLGRDGNPVQVIEAQPTLPNNHSAVLRFRSSIVSDVLGIPFKKVRVMRTVQQWRNELASSLAYSAKATGQIAMRSSIRENSGMVDRYIAPDYLIRDMAEGISIQYGSAFDFTSQVANESGPVISTVPMPVLAKALNYRGFDDGAFQYSKGYNMSFRIPGIDVYGTVYIPDPDCIWNRVSITGDWVVAEYSDIRPRQVNKTLEALSNGTTLEPRSVWELVLQAITPLGLEEIVPLSIVMSSLKVKQQAYQKIMPISDRKRKQFMLWASETYNIYSLGRFATWRPGLLLDDLVNDVRMIEHFADDNYARRIKGAN
mgnify:FL=1